MQSDPQDQGIHLEVLHNASLRVFRGGGEIGFLLRNLKSGQTAVDVGANIGFFTLLFARQVGPKGKVISFEPGPKSFRLLEQNIRENGYGNVVANNAAVGDRNGAIDLLVCRTGESDNRIAAADSADRDRVSVPLFSLDEYFPVSTRIDFLKIDVQGAEPLVLKGARRVIADNPQIKVVMEFWPQGMSEAGHSPPELLEAIADLGLDLHELPENGKEHRTSTAAALSTKAHINLVLKRPQRMLAKALEIIGAMRS